MEKKIGRKRSEKGNMTRGYGGKQNYGLLSKGKMELKRRGGVWMDPG